MGDDEGRLTPPPIDTGPVTGHQSTIVSASSSPSPRRRPRLSLGTRFSAQVDGSPTSPDAATTGRASLSSATSRTTSQQQPRRSRQRHRHSDTIDSALAQLKVLALETRPPNEHDNDRVGVCQCLQAAGWQHQSTTDGVRIFTKAPDHQTTLEHHRRGPIGTAVAGAATTTTTTTTAAGGGLRTQAGVRKDEDLPWIRGEAFIAGAWQPRDVVQTLQSPSARSMWDQTLGSNSHMVELLSETDTLWMMHIRNSLGADSAGALVMTVDVESDGLPQTNNVAYLASVSVEDALCLNPAQQKTKIHLNGWCLRALPKAPWFEQPPASLANDDSPATSGRPGHRRLKSSVSIKNNGLLSPSYLPPPLPAAEALSYFPLAAAGSPNLMRTNSTGADSAHQDEERYRNVEPLDFPQFAVQKNRPSLPPTTAAAMAATTTSIQDDRPGLHVSLITHVSPGFNLSQTMVNQISLNIPLLCASVGRYLSTHGFAPYVERQPKSSGFVILDEHFEPQAGVYRLVFRVDGTEHDGPPTKIRFHGQGFGKGRFELVVENGLDDWQLDYDQEPSVQPETVYVDEHGEDRPEDEPTDVKNEVASRRNKILNSTTYEDGDATARRPPPRRRKTSLSVKASPLTTSTSVTATGTNDGTSEVTSPLSPTSIVSPSTATRGRHHRQVSTPLSSALQNAANATAAPRDLATLPGPLGGCTLTIPRHDTTRQHPITVTISRTSSNDTRNPLDRLKLVHETIGKASRLSSALQTMPLFDSVEEMLQARGGDSSTNYSRGIVNGGCATYHHGVVVDVDEENNKGKDVMARARLKLAAQVLKEIQLNQANERAKHADDNVDTLARELAHDVGHHAEQTHEVAGALGLEGISKAV
ncbi:hypothetical protein OIO90_001699 [Microbotryomycetes sp. JL221]|nr:hypothetical protein OIO90_001699 [Microbotryomycetes sp. JL221]